LEAICGYYESRVPIESNRCAGAIQAFVDRSQCSLLVCLQVVTVIMPDVEQFSPGSLQKVAGNRQLGRSFSALGEHEFNVAALNRHVKAWRVALAQLGAECI